MSTVLQGNNNSDEVVMVHATQRSNSVMLTPPRNRVFHQPPTNNVKSRKLLAVGITPQTKSSKNLDYVVGGAMTKNGNTLYCKAEMMVPFTFTYASECDPRSRIRVRAEYTEERYTNKPVERCPNHLVKDGSDVKMHFVRCEHAETEYLDSNENYALRIPLCDTTGFMFTCFSSCSGGINRRPVQLTFVLEGVDGSRLEMFSVPLKVCANPLRDASKEDERKFEHNFETTYNNVVATQRKRVQRVGNDLNKRARYRDAIDDNCQLIECHFVDAIKMKKCLWYLANEEKFDQLICMEMDNNPFRDICVVTTDTTLKAWLNKRDIGLGSLIDKFECHSIFTLGDLAKTFARFGFEPGQCSILNKAFQDWYRKNRAIAAGQEKKNGLARYPQLPVS
ncbi:P53 DNA-binding domain protein [Dictyocaulus viviparus]|uniref:p53 DNA-binding domain protein n=1 Tax=Dictyocaulus viviparus TaxID=29172 RepID=A0A0D8Y6I2_DICVI|nr:P53 DNA-binding domain protein [Dictyocaulus viviparus]